MPNRSCDICHNHYKINPTVGYYKVTEKMRIVLQIDQLEDSHYDFICGEHFTEASFELNGRLARDSVPTLFPYRECLHHDHTYVTSAEESIGRETGKSRDIYWTDWYRD